MIIIAVIIMLLIVLVYACCVIQKDGEQIEVYRKVYKHFERYHFKTEKMRIKAEMNAIQEYIERGILPDKCMKTYEI